MLGEPYSISEALSLFKPPCLTYILFNSNVIYDFNKECVEAKPQKICKVRKGILPIVNE